MMALTPPVLRRFACVILFAVLDTCPALAAPPVVLSTVGSGRATAYSEQAKIITVGDRTHVAWLDGEAEGFRVRIRTLDRTTGEWSPATTVGEAMDNHGGPGLTVDSQGYLHIVYYPHHDVFRYRRSLRPNDASAWGPEEQFGEGLSFPTMLCAPDDTLILTARRGFHDAQRVPQEHLAVEQELWKKPPGGEWRKVSTLLRSREAGYSQFAVGMAWGPDHRTIHLNTRLYEGHPPKTAYPRHTIGYLVSHDAGETWAKADGTPVTLPAMADTVDVVAPDEGPDGPKFQSGPLSVDAQGVPHLVYTSIQAGITRLFLATPAASGGWTRRELTSSLPAAWHGCAITLNMGGGISFSDSGRVTIVAVVSKLTPEEARDPAKEWGHPTTEVVRLWSDDGLLTLQSEILQPEDATRAHWLANLERATGHNRVPDEPGIIYTAGDRGAHVGALELANEVRWQPKN